MTAAFWGFRALLRLAAVASSLPAEATYPAAGLVHPLGWKGSGANLSEAPGEFLYRCFKMTVLAIPLSRRIFESVADAVPVVQRTGQSR